MTDLLTGQVTWFSKEKGYGFIKCKDKDYFAHYKNIAMLGFKELLQGQKVTFRSTKSDKGLVAEDIRLIEEYLQ